MTNLQNQLETIDFLSSISELQAPLVENVSSGILGDIRSLKSNNTNNNSFSHRNGHSLDHYQSNCPNINRNQNFIKGKN